MYSYIHMGDAFISIDKEFVGINVSPFFLFPSLTQYTTGLKYVNLSMFL